MNEMSKEQAEAIIRSVTGLSADNAKALDAALEIGNALITAVHTLQSYYQNDPNHTRMP